MVKVNRIDRVGEQLELGVEAKRIYRVRQSIELGVNVKTIYRELGSKSSEGIK